MLGILQADLYRSPSYLYPEIQWEDKEPRELILKPIK